ncbi:MAG: FtsX-like permease family protein [Luteitalea sp.]|nr:FtsX-like permease family protein [Luteitalea sp.]
MASVRVFHGHRRGCRDCRLVRPCLASHAAVSHGGDPRRAGIRVAICASAHSARTVKETGVSRMRSVLWQAWQSWKGAKGVAVLATIALAIGIGSTTAIYTVVNSVMLKPLPYEYGERYGALFSATVGEPDSFGSLIFQDVLEYQQATRSFDVFGWFKPQSFNVTSPGPPQYVEGALVAPSLAHNLGVQPILGQWFRDETGAVISRALWMRLGGDQSILGKAIALNGRSYTITGVMPPWFRLPEGWGELGGHGSAVWVGLDPSGKGQDPNDGFWFCYARLKPGVTFAQADAEVKVVAAQIAKKDPGSHATYTARLDPLQTHMIKEIRPTLLLLFAAAGLLLLITCANVAGLLLARSVARARETAIRVALGASQWQLARHYFVEGLFVSLAGAVAGGLLSFWLVRSVVSIAADRIPRADQIAIDWTVLLFALGTACLASALSSLAPLWQAVRTPPREVLGEGARASARSRRLSQSLVIGEIALAFALLVVSTILIVHLRNLTRIWPGFDANNLLRFQLTLPDSLAAKGETRVPHQIRLVQMLESLPGVSGVAVTNQTPLAGCCYGAPVYPEGRPTNLGVARRTSFLPISPGYFQTMRIPLQSGRLLTYRDSHSELQPVVINQAAARRYWGSQNPLGAYARMGTPDGSRFRVVGIVGDVRNDGLSKPTVPEVYMLHTWAWMQVNPTHFVVRSTLPPETLVPEIRRAIRRIDPTQPIHGVATMNEIAHGSVARERVGSLMTAFFALAALLMATLGVYGVVSYSVRQRRVEMGTRMALGAASRDLLLLIVGGGLKMALYGVAIGTITVMASAWLLVRVFEVHDLGWLPFVSSTAIVVGVATLASFFPAWRATLLSPMVAIRDEPGSVWESARQSIRR